MIEITSPDKCCGCSACASICPQNAIKMSPDNLGFLYPVINKDECINCGACDRVCQFNDFYDISTNYEKPETYAARHINIDEVDKSRSGAIFAAISDYIISQDGVVYGAGFTDHFRVVHKRAVTAVERDEFRGSKYVQSDLTGIFPFVKKDLVEGRLVLFSGTPCQISGLKGYIGKSLRKNLLLIDLVCHGVPSPYIWRDYIDYIEKKTHDEIIAVNFRDKRKYGWKAHKESFTFKHKSLWEKGTYTNLFNKHIMFRHSCGNCPFANLRRPGDITLADFWGWETVVPDFNKDDKGISLLLINTEKGTKIFNLIKEKIITQKVEIEQCLQPNLQHPSRINLKRDLFEKDYSKKGFKYIKKKYVDVGIRHKIQTLVHKIIRK